MITYVSAFIFYTLAMIGVLLIGYVVYKKVFMYNKCSSKGCIEIIDNLPIAPKKNLMVVKIKDEKFLIASGENHTTFLSKLETENPQIVLESSKQPEIKNNRSEEVNKKFNDLYYSQSENESGKIIDGDFIKTNPIEKLRNAKKRNIKKMLEDYDDSNVVWGKGRING